MSDHHPEPFAGHVPLRPISVSDLVAAHPDMRPIVIDGILRKGETANIIAAPKVGKSYLAGNLAWAVATGTPWLSHDVAKGRVLILDNELHPETVASRLTHIADEMHVPLDARDQVDAIVMRGLSAPMNAIEFHVDVEPGRYALVVVDALYRTLPNGTSENDNAAMMAVYNHIDKLAAHWQAAIVVVHHSSKGNQGDKALTDMGSGAGTISRAADTHIAIRPHETEGHHVLEAVTRSFKSPEPVSIAFNWPLWKATTLTPAVKRPNQGSAEKRQKDDQDADELLLEAIQARPKLSESQIVRMTGMGPGRVSRAVGRAIAARRIEQKRIKRMGRRVVVYLPSATESATPQKTPS